MRTISATRDKARSAGTKDDERSEAARWIDKLIIGSLFLFAAFAPHSIAVTQIAWILGMLLWTFRFFCFPRPVFRQTPLDYALLGFFILTGVSTLFSYEPLVSVGKLRAASLFTIVYLFAQNIPSRSVIRLLVLTIVASCSINVIYTAGERALGRGVKIISLKTESPLYAAGVRAGDTLLEFNGKRINNPGDLVEDLAIPNAKSAQVKIYRHELVPVYRVERGKLLSGSTASEELGIESWSRGRDWRASGFFGHYVTYAEALQLILALSVGLLVSLPVKRSWLGALLLLAIAGFCFSLVLTVTRASWLAFLISSAVIILLGTSRRTMLAIAVVSIPVILGGLFFLQQKRDVRFIDPTDQSTTWRETVWREGFNMLVSSPRHMLVGVGMDSIKAHWREWGMFDHGRQPIGHMHSNLLQIAFERGIPALLVWLVLQILYARLLWRLKGRLKQDSATSSDLIGSWIDYGLVLGALGGLTGFFVSGLVHYNWGDSEVVMILYFIVGLVLALDRFMTEQSRRSELPQ